VTQKKADHYPANANDFKKSVASNEHRASIARRTGISGHIKFAEKDGSQSASVHAKAINAIIAAVFFDCKREIGTVARMMHHLGLVRSAILTRAR
jgi:dsRNA-specific ribonuclease